jgi:hypothetical protein
VLHAEGGGQILSAYLALHRDAQIKEPALSRTGLDAVAARVAKLPPGGLEQTRNVLCSQASDGDQSTKARELADLVSSQPWRNFASKVASAARDWPLSADDPRFAPPTGPPTTEEPPDWQFPTSVETFASLDEIYTPYFTWALALADQWVGEEALARGIVGYPVPYDSLAPRPAWPSFLPGLSPLPHVPRD